MIDRELRPSRGAGDRAPTEAIPLAFDVEGLRYELDRAPIHSGRPVVLSARHVGAPEGSRIVDRVDLYAFRSRSGFAKIVAKAFGKTAAQVMIHLDALLSQLDEAPSQGHSARPLVLTEARRQAAETLLRDPHLLDHAASTLSGLGLVAEEENKRLAYLVATSRLLRHPLTAAVYGTTGAGKTELVDRLEEILPPESVVRPRLMGSRRFDLPGADELRHKLVIVDEMANPTRRLAERDAMAVITTTYEDPTLEDRAHCLVLGLDESAEQTRRIEVEQRRAATGEARQHVDVALWQDAQRFLEPLEVVIPSATEVGCLERWTERRCTDSRRMTLVAAHALLHQIQRERDHQGRVVATAEDCRAVQALLSTNPEAEPRPSN